MSLTKTPQNVKEFRSICKGGKLSIFSNMPKPSSKKKWFNDERRSCPSGEVSLTMGDSVEILWPLHVEEDMLKMNDNMLFHGRRLQE